MFRTLVAAIAITIATGSPALRAQSIVFEFEQIPTFSEPNPDTLGLGLAINELGEVVGIAEDAGFIARGFVYAAGQLTEVPGFNPDTTSHPRAINQFGDVVGGAGMRVTMGGQPVIVTVPFHRRAGQGLRSILSNDLIVSWGFSGSALTLNDSGFIAYDISAGVIETPAGDNLDWGFPDGDIIATGTINQFGRIVGTGLRFGGPGFEALQYDVNDGSVVNLHDPGRASMSFAVDINNAGVAVGFWNRLEDNRTVPVRWRNGVGTPLPFVNEQVIGWIARATAINDRGDILGESSNGNGERVDWLLLAGESRPFAILNRVDGAYFDRFDEFMAFDLNNSREIAGAAISTDPSAPLGSTNKAGIMRPRQPQTPAFPAPGLWADPARPGSGFDINRVGDRHYLVWYTFDEAGLPTWYFSDTVRMVRDGWRADLLEFFVTASGSIASVPVGQVVLFNRRPTEMVFSWRLDGRSGSTTFRYLAGPCEAGALGRTGTWYDPADSGFGLSLQDAGDRQAGVFYFYDFNGIARWAYLNYPDGPGLTAAWLYRNGSCPYCTYRAPLVSTIGTGRLDFAAETIDLEVSLFGTGSLAAMTWQSANTMRRIPSAPTCQAR